VFGVSYTDDIDKTKALLNRLIDEEPKVLDNPGRTVVLSELADSSVNFTVRVWVNTADYWDVYFNMQENVKKAMDQEGISIPFPQRDVHMIQDSQ
jgi:small conductance mechanosensitive channel